MISAETNRLLGEIGLLAAGYGLTAHAQAILAAVQDHSPTSGAPAIGASILLMNAGRNDEAADALERALAGVDERDRGAVTAFLGWALQRSGHNARSAQVLRTLIDGEDAGDSAAKEMAAALLNGGGSSRQAAR